MVWGLGFVVLGLLGLAIIVFGLWRAFYHSPAFPVSDEDHVVEVNGYRIRYRDLPGEGTPLVFIHGTTLSLDFWAGVLPEVHGRRRVALDLIGFGGSDRPRLSYDIRCHQEHFFAFLDALGIDRAILVGHSYGGVMAAWYAAHVPERVEALIIMQAPGVPGSMITYWPKSLILKPGFLNRLAYVIANSPPFVRRYPRCLARQDLGLTSSIFNQAYRDTLARVEQPALLMMSRDDDSIRWECREEYLELLPDVEFQEIPPGVEHGAPRGWPLGTARAVEGFVERVDPLKPEGRLADR